MKICIGILSCLLITMGKIRTEVHVQLDREYHPGYFKLGCYVSNLKLPLVFIFNNEDKAHCTSVYPSSLCITYIKNSRIEQNILTNITTLEILNPNPDLLNGRWGCVYGLYNSTIKVNIDVSRILPGAECLNMAYQSEMTAFFVFMIGTVVILGHVDILKDKTATTNTESNRMRRYCNCVAHIFTCRWIKRGGVRQAIQTAICGFLLLFAILIPLASDRPTRDKYICIIPYAFLGVFLGPIVAMLILLVYTDSHSKDVKRNSPDNGREDGASNTVVYQTCPRNESIDVERNSPGIGREDGATIGDDDHCSTSLSVLQTSCRAAATNYIHIDQQTSQRTQEMVRLYVYVTIKFIQSKQKTHCALLSFDCHGATVIYY